MATVRLSNALVEEILRNAGLSQTKIVDRAMMSRPSNDWAEKIYTRLLGEEIALVEKIPAEWFHYVTGFRVLWVGNLDAGQLDFTFSSPMRWPRAINNKRGKLIHDGGVDLVLSADEWPDLLAEVLEWRDKVKRAKTNRDEFRFSIRKILDSYSTLAPALKAWPPLWEFVPEKVKDKHKEVSVKESKREGVSLDVDLSKLTALATATKIG